MNALTTVERKQDVRLSEPSGYVRRRIGQEASNLSLAGQMAACVELVNESLCRLTEMLYEPEVDGGFANVDMVTWRILIPVPWGSQGWRVWGLRAWEAEALRKLLLVRSEMQRHVRLYDYNEVSYTWHLNLHDYPTYDLALAYLERHPVTLQDWRRQASAYKQRRINAVAAAKKRKAKS